MSVQGDKWPFGDFSTQWPKEGFEMMTKGLDMYNKMTKSWMEMMETSNKAKPEEAMKQWTDAFGGIYKDMFEMFSQPFKMFGVSPFPEKMNWEEPFRQWQQMLSSAMPGGAVPAVPSYQGIDDFVKFSRGWQESYAKVFTSWLDSVEKMAGACRTGMEKGDEPDKVVKACMESTEAFFDEWTKFVTGQTKAFFQLWKTAYAKEKPAAKKGAPKGKE